MQIPIQFDNRPALDLEDYIVTKCNIEAVSMIDSWPNWPFFAVCVYGDEGSGKTHLSNVFSNLVLSKNPKLGKVPVYQAKDIKEDMIEGLICDETSKCIIIENADDGDFDEDAMFHLYNSFRSDSGFILFTARTAPSRWKLKLPDLKTRLNIMPMIEIKEPDDELLSMLIVKLFSDRQVQITPDVVSYLTKNIERSFKSTKIMVDEIDRYSLAKKRAITVPLVKSLMKEIEEEKASEPVQSNFGF